MTMDTLISESNFDEIAQQDAAGYNLGDLKREEEVLISLYSKMKDQLLKLEVEELELKQKIRRKDLQETTAELVPPPTLPTPVEPIIQKKKQSAKGKAPRRRKHDRTSSLSHDEGASELEDTMSVTSALSQTSPVRSVRSTPTRKSPRAIKDSPSKYAASRLLTIPAFEAEPEQPESLDLSALNAFSLPTGFGQSALDFVESEDEG